jgi:hypothetical protein
MVGEGIAFAYVKYGDDYAALEQQAAAVNRGLHATRMQSPAAHRAAARKTQEAPDKSCVIKGNISADGTRIYHQPGQNFYARTVIDQRKGELWFCSAAAATAAGWRAARR